MMVLSRILVMMIALLLVSCGDEQQKSHWLEKEITVDGKSEDWDQQPIKYHKDLNIGYGIVNNDTAFFLMLRFNDQRLAQQLSIRGLTMWFSNPDDGDQEFGIDYRSDAPARGRKNTGRQDMEQPPQGFIPSGQFTLVKDDDDFMPLSLVGFPQLKAAFDFNDGFYCLEYAISLNASTDYSIEFNVKAIGQLELDIVLNAPDREKMMAGAGQSGGMQGGGGHGGGGKGGGRGGGKGGKMGGSPEGMSDQEISLLIKLAAKP